MNDKTLYLLQNGMTPLHVACRRNNMKVVQLLLKHGVPINITTSVSVCNFISSKWPNLRRGWFTLLTGTLVRNYIVKSCGRATPQLTPSSHGKADVPIAIVYLFIYSLIHIWQTWYHRRNAETNKTTELNKLPTQGNTTYCPHYLPCFQLKLTRNMMFYYIQPQHAQNLICHFRSC